MKRKLVDKVVTMNYGKLIDNSNVGLKQTLKKILKDVDKRIETSANKECDTTEYETRIQELTNELGQARETITELESQINNFTPPSDSTIYQPELNIDLASGYFNSDSIDAIIAESNVIRFTPTFTIPLNRTAIENGYGNMYKQLADANIGLPSVKLNDIEILDTINRAPSIWGVDNSTGVLYTHCYFGLVGSNIPYNANSQYTVEMTLKNRQNDKSFVFTAIIDGETKKYITENN